MMFKQAKIRLHTCCCILLLDTKMVAAKESPTVRGRMRLGSGTERLGHHSRPGVSQV